MNLTRLVARASDQETEKQRESTHSVRQSNYIYICMYMCVCLSMYIYIYVFIYLCMYLFIYLFIYLNMCVILALEALVFERRTSNEAP